MLITQQLFERAYNLTEFKVLSVESNRRRQKVEFFDCMQAIISTGCNSKRLQSILVRGGQCSSRSSRQALPLA
jgi:hypothetical protein